MKKTVSHGSSHDRDANVFMMFDQLSEYVHALKMFFLPSCFLGVLLYITDSFVNFQFSDFSVQI